MTHRHHVTALRAAEATDRAEFEEANRLWREAASQAESFCDVLWDDALDAERANRFTLASLYRTWAEQANAEAETYKATAA